MVMEMAVHLVSGLGRAPVPAATGGPNPPDPLDDNDDGDEDDEEEPSDDDDDDDRGGTEDHREEEGREIAESIYITEGS